MTKFCPLDFRKKSIDLCVYSKVYRKIIILVLYEGDIFLATYDLSLLHTYMRLRSFFKKNFEMKDMSETINGDVI